MDVMTVALRPMTSGDVSAVAALERVVYSDPWSEAAFSDELASPGRVYVVAEDGAGELVGYAGLLVVVGDAHVTTVAVAPQRRGGRIGTRLMLRLATEALAAGAAHLTLEVRTSNQAAQRLYRRFGFDPVGVRKHYYRDEDALVMWAIDIDRPEYRAQLEEIARSLP